MPRTLPWARGEGHTKSHPQRPVGTSILRARTKRQALFDASSDIDQASEDGDQIRTNKGSRARDSLSSPPVDPPQMIFMKEGIQHDDRFRMVEDEFLSIAQEFTRHLHAAEYKRMKKAAKSENVATIRSISRPVTTKMPDSTKRKVEDVARSRKQASTLQGLLGKDAEALDADPESDDDGGAWVGTALHGLMDSPKKAAASLLDIGPISAGPNTKSAVGLQKRGQFNRRYSKSKVAMSTELEEVPSPTPVKKGKNLEEKLTESTETSDDDDLDGPIRPWTRDERVKAEELEQIIEVEESKQAHSTSYKPTVTMSKSRELSTRRADSLIPQISHPRNVAAVPSEKQNDVMLPPSRSESATRIARRLEQARQRQHQIKPEIDEKKKSLDIIPTFL